jgi:hypothetical protein
VGRTLQNVTVLRALIVVAVVLTLATLVTGALRPSPVQSLAGRAHAADGGHPSTCAGDPEVSSAGDIRARLTIPREKWSDVRE